MVQATMNNKPCPQGTKLCGLIGKPLGHTLSPLMHNAAFNALKLDYKYLELEIDVEELGDTIKNLKDQCYRGLNVTIPYKCQVMEYLDEIDDLARKIGAVNTIVNNDGVLIGYNTDAYGAMAALKSNIEAENFLKMVNVKCKVLILGAGGAARAVSFALAQQGMEILIVNRTFEKGNALAKELRKLTSSEALLIEDLNQYANEISIMINCSPIGMEGDLENCSIDIPDGIIRNGLVVFDIVYKPKNTPLLKKAKQKGAQIIYGYEMLVHQGARSFELWTGIEAPLEVMRKVVIENLDTKQ